MTGLIADPQTLKRASHALQSSSAWQRGERLPADQLFPPSPELSDRDHEALRALYSALRKCCGEAKRLGVRVDIDVRDPRPSPVLSLLRLSNRGIRMRSIATGSCSPASTISRRSLRTAARSCPRRRSVCRRIRPRADPSAVFQTYQTYRTDAEQRLAADLALARQRGFSFGAKVVRGAYVDAENALAKQRGVVSPIWKDKPSTDKCFDRCVDTAQQR